MPALRDLLAEAVLFLKASDLPDALLEAEILLAHVLRADRLYLHAHPDQEIPESARAEMLALLRRRSRREPVAYLSGGREFFGRVFAVTPAVLIPRPETEILVECLLKRLPRNCPTAIADIGTGSGIIAISLVAELPLARAYAADLSPDALEVAHLNARNLGVENRIVFLQGDLCHPLESMIEDHSLDAVCSNPPYIPTSRVEMLEPEIRNWEPRMAIDAGADGTAPTRQIIAQAPRFLKPGGWLALEMEAGSSEAVAALILAEDELEMEAVVPDLAGIERVALARRRR
ncbi:MAG: peptide chain release factor N(5)-glutamine methyltransferase [Armatimonadetes bacterium]|nr:peptide chain release factor N(5)-glutamine methyltransferase [Armatimonadota bacterium]